MSRTVSTVKAPGQATFKRLDCMIRAASQLGFSYVETNNVISYQNYTSDKVVGVFRHPNWSYDLAVTRATGTDGYDFEYDSWRMPANVCAALGYKGIHGEAVQGFDFPNLMMHYNMRVDEAVAAEVGDTVTFSQLADGSWESVTTPSLSRMVAGI